MPRLRQLLLSTYFVVVTAPFTTIPVSTRPELRWTQTSPNAEAILYEYARGVEIGVVYRIAGPLPVIGCPP